MDLEWNSIGDDGAKALADGLKHCPELQTLNLEWNSIGADGAKALADGLKNWPDLQTLNLKRNRIGADGAKALCDGLSHCPDLQIQHFQSRIVSEYSMDRQEKCLTSKSSPIDPHQSKNWHYPDFTSRMRSPQRRFTSTQTSSISKHDHVEASEHTNLNSHIGALQ